MYGLVGNAQLNNVNRLGLVSASEIAVRPSLPLAGEHSFSVSAYGYENLGENIKRTSPEALVSFADWKLTHTVRDGSSISIGYSGTICGHVLLTTSRNANAGDMYGSVDTKVDYTGDAYNLQKWESGTESYNIQGNSCPNGWKLSAHYTTGYIFPSPIVSTGKCSRKCSRSAYRLVGKVINTDVLGLSKYYSNGRVYEDIETIQREMNSQIENAVRSQISASFFY